MKNLFSLILVFVLFSVSVTWAQTPTAAPATRRTGAISGRVVVEDGSLASGAQISLSPVGVDNFGASQGTTADEEGNFTINNLEARVYRVYASIPGYVSTGEEDPWRQARIGDVVTINLVNGGVITGKVTTPGGDPVIGLSMSATRVRDGDGKPTQRGGNFGSSVQTDDRGVYRIYGLAAGSYLVGANATGFAFSVSPYLGDKPVYHPSSSRETAAEVQVQPGSVASGIDIQYRSEAGHVVSGKVSGAWASNESGGVSVYLNVPGTSQRVAHTSIQASFGQSSSGNNGFELRGVPNGEFEIVGYRYGQMGVTLARSTPRRIRVNNADVGGIELALAPLASVSGTVALEPLTELKPEEKALCVKGRPSALYEVLLRAQVAQSTTASSESSPFGGMEAVPDEKGAFTLNGLDPGSYRLSPNLPGESWYVKSIETASAPATTGAAKRPAGVGNAGLLTLRSGDKLTGVTVTLAEGAAQVSGKLEGKLSQRMRVHLVPAEAALANDVLRYYETLARADGAFRLSHLAPGKYWLIAKPLAADESAETAKRPLAWEAMERTALRKAAEAAQQTVELGACVRISGYKLK